MIFVTNIPPSPVVLALLSLNVKKGDEVIVPNLTYVAPVNAINYVGAKPILVDVNKENWLMEIDKIKEKINKKTKAILLVHLYGTCYNLDQISALKKRYKIKIIEDCAEAIGTKYKKVCWISW